MWIYCLKHLNACAGLGFCTLQFHLSANSHLGYITVKNQVRLLVLVETEIFKIKVGRGLKQLYFFSS